MLRSFLSQFIGCLCVAFIGHSAIAQQPSDFAHDVLPVLKKHCVPCHGGREAKGSFSMNHRELVVDSGHIVPGKPEESHLLSLILSSDRETQMPPADRERLSDREKDVIRKWIADGVPWEEGFSFAPAAYEPPLKPRRPELPAAVDGRVNPVDRILDADLAAHQIARPSGIDDAAFLRRVSLDLVGLLPKPEELNEFVADKSPDKRAKVVRKLLDDKVAYAEHWLSFFNDLLRNDYSGTGFITGGRQQVSGWLYEALVSNKPFDQFARELIAPPTSASQGYIDGIRWRGEVSAGQTVEIQFAQSVSQSFLGINLKCASCHDSFIDRWKLEEAYSLAAIYSAQPMQIHRCDKPIGKQAVAKWLFPELGDIDAAAPREERLKQLAALMTHPDNGRFTRTIVNRLWYKLMGRGIVHPLDAMQSEPWNADLLDHLAVHLTDNKYDLKSVLYLIATSEAYQSKCVTRRGESTEGSSGKYVYQGPVPRRMTAEQFLDSVWQITAAAPTAFDAPVIRMTPQAVGTEPVTLQAKWIWSDSAARGNVPQAGEAILLRKQFKLSDEVHQGGAIVTCDNGFTLFVNGREVKSGSEWTKTEAVPLRGLLKKGENTIIAIATNAGNGPNAAGFFFESRMTLANGESVTVMSDETWEWNAKVPPQKEGRLGRITGDWKPVTIVPALNVWTNSVTAAGPNLLMQALTGNLQMIRASLMKNDFLMRSLGRPFREQIVSMRPTELTTLEAIDLSNGATLAGYLSTGAANLANGQHTDKTKLIVHLYEFALSRKPLAEEKAILDEALSSPPTAQEIEDVLWSIFMMPEFFLVR
ncbi:MAG: DUF1549 domain-containing protein [Planctomycetaceae bacterium]